MVVLAYAHRLYPPPPPRLSLSLSFFLSFFLSFSLLGESVRLHSYGLVSLFLLFLQKKKSSAANKHAYQYIYSSLCVYLLF